MRICTRGRAGWRTRSQTMGFEAGGSRCDAGRQPADIVRGDGGSRPRRVRPFTYVHPEPRRGSPLHAQRGRRSGAHRSGHVETPVPSFREPSDRSPGGPASQATARPATVNSASPRWISRVHQESSLSTVRPPRITATTTRNPTEVAARRWVNSSQMWVVEGRDYLPVAERPVRARTPGTGHPDHPTQSDLSDRRYQAQQRDRSVSCPARSCARGDLSHS